MGTRRCGLAGGVQRTQLQGKLGHPDYLDCNTLVRLLVFVLIVHRSRASLNLLRLQSAVSLTTTRAPLAAWRMYELHAACTTCFTQCRDWRVTVISSLSGCCAHRHVIFASCAVFAVLQPMRSMSGGSRGGCGYRRPGGGSTHAGRHGRRGRPS